MRKSFLVIMLMLQVQMIFAQEDSKFFRTRGIILGSGISTFHSEWDATSFEPKPLMYFGVFAGREYSRFGYLTKFEYESKGARKLEGNWNYSLHYITLEPGLTLKFKPVNLMLGPYASLLLFRKVTSDSEYLSSYTADGFKRSDLGGFIGLQCNLFEISGYNVLVNLQANYGFISIFKGATTNSHLSNWESKWDRNLAVKAGFSLILK